MAVTPSDVQAIYNMLSNSLSDDKLLRETAGATLSQFENRPGFCSCLLEIIVAREVACREDVRLLATVYFKNSINRYWRNRRDLGVTSDEKIHLRNKLLLAIREDNFKISVQLAVLISKIARIDYPKEWSELIHFLAQSLQSADALTSHRAFMVLHRTLKELSTKRLTSDQKLFAEIASQLFDYAWKLWQNDVQNIMQKFSILSQNSADNPLAGEQNDLLLVCERWLLCTKIIRQLTVSGYPRDVLLAQEVPQVKAVCSTFLKAIQSLLPYYSSPLEKHNRFWDFNRKACIKLMKALVAIQCTHPYSFGDRNVLPATLDFCLSNITSPESGLTSFDQFLIQCMVLCKSVLECKEYKPCSIGHVVNERVDTIEQRKKNLSLAAFNLLASTLRNEHVILLCNILIKRYFIYTAKDLDEWYHNPESFHHEQDMIQWTERMRPCAEALYIVLFENHRLLLGPVVVSILREAMRSSPPMEAEITLGMLLKDAAYTAAGHVYYELSVHLNFDEWFNGTLSIELSNNHPNMRIVHRKIALVLGQWVSEVKGNTRKLVYHALIKLLQESDIAVRLAACRSLCYHVEDSTFCEEDFFELLPTCFNFCFRLVDDVQEFDSKVQVLNLICVLIEHVGEKTVPFAGQLLEFFHKIWEESASESLLQIQLLTALRIMISVLGYQSPMCYNILLPILQKGIDVNSPDELNLLEDSVLLWETTLSHAPSITLQLLNLFPYLVGIFERSFDHLQVGTSIIEDYVIFSGSEFLNRHASSLVKLLDLVVGNVNDKGLLCSLPIIEMLVQCFPIEVPPLIHGILQKLIIICLSVDDDRNPSKAAVHVYSAAVLARLLVMNANYFGHLVSDPSLALAIQHAGLPNCQNFLLSLVDIWLDKIDNANVTQKKIYALALSIILTKVPQVIDRLDDILSVSTGVILGGNGETSEEDSSTSTSGVNSEGLGYNGIPSKELRRTQIQHSDPIKKLSLESILKENLEACASFHGEASFNEAISRIHPSAFAQLKQALNMA